MRFGLILLVLYTLTSCGEIPRLGPATDDSLASASQDDCNFVQNSYGQRVSWKGQLPIVLIYHPSLPAEFKTIFKKAALHWEEVAGKTLFKFVDGTSSTPKETVLDGQNVIAWQDTWNKDNSSQQALTSLYWRSNVIQDADLSINGKNFTFFVDNYSTTRDVHLESLFIHEIGHILGLKHRSDVESVMWAVLNGAIKRDVLTEADRTTLKCEY